MKDLKDLSIILGGKLVGREKLNLEDTNVFENISIADASELARKLESSGTKIIICAVGTYAKIHNIVNIPIIPVITTLFDLLETIRDFEKTAMPPEQKIACILHDSRTVELYKIQPFVKSWLYLYTYKQESDIKELMPVIMDNGIRSIVGGPTSVYQATLLGLKTWPLYFGPETMSVALDKGRSVLAAIKTSLERSVHMNTILNLFSYGIIITDNNGVITACNPSALEQLDVKGTIVGQRIYETIPDDTWITSYVNGRQSHDQIKNHGKNRFFVSDYPIILPDNRIVGSVATFQKVEAVEKLEQKYRKIKTAGLTARSEFKDIIGASDAIIKTVDKANAYSKVDSTVLIEGETGAGKEIFAQSIHNASNRRYGPFVALNCAALPENLLESELMGYEEGAFTGARRGGKNGLLELADKGTIFLDEINQISPSIQGRLLRVIQEKQVLRLGGERVIPVDVRIISATNESLEEKVQNNEFREDLYYRLNVLNLSIPPIRRRKEDIPLLLEHFIRHFSKTHGPLPVLSPNSLEILANYNWPGNVREMYNFVERYAVLIKSRSISEAEFIKEYTNKRRPLQKGQADAEENTLKIKFGTLESMERELIEKTLALAKGNKACTALMLGISRTTLWKKIKG